MTRVGVAATVLLLLVASFGSGCLGEFAAEPAPGATDEGPSRSGAGAPVDGKAPAAGDPDPEPAEAPAPSRSERWHFHNYWGNNPNLTLFEGWVPLEPAPGAACCPPGARVASGHFAPAEGKIVPPETGQITLALTWNGTAGAPLNLSYRSAGASAYRAHGPVDAGANATLTVTENMTDLPHADVSEWAFRIAADLAEGGAPAAPPDAVHVTAVARIGGPIYIDPPHVDRWNGSRTLRVAAWEGEVDAAVRAGDTHGTLQGGSVAVQGGPLARIVPSAQVPEGAQAVLVRLTWASDAPEASTGLALRYEESGTGAAGMPEPSGADDGLREYRIPVSPPMTDNPYSNRTAWVFHVVLDGDAGAFRGALRLDAWVTRDPPNQAEFPEAR